MTLLFESHGKNLSCSLTFQILRADSMWEQAHGILLGVSFCVWIKNTELLIFYTDHWASLWSEFIIIWHGELGTIPKIGWCDSDQTPLLAGRLCPDTDSRLTKPLGLVDSVLDWTGGPSQMSLQNPFPPSFYHWNLFKADSYTHNLKTETLHSTCNRDIQPNADTDLTS